MSVKVVNDKVGALMAELKTLTLQKVMIGIPAEADDRSPQDGDAIGNAELLWIHEHGSPVKNIPARPTLIPGVKTYQPKAEARLKAAANAAIDAALDSSPAPVRDVDRVLHSPSSTAPLSQPAQGVQAQFTAIGLEAVASVKSKFTDGSLAPLKPATIAARKRAGFDGESPLIRTGDLMRHITFVIRKSK